MLKKIMIGLLLHASPLLLSGCNYFGYCYYSLHGDPDLGLLFFFEPVPERDFTVNMYVPSGQFITV